MAPRTCSDCPAAISAKSKGRCRPCSMKRINSDPVLTAKREAAIAVYGASPKGRATSAANMRRYNLNLSPAERAARSERGKRTAREVLTRPDVMARSHGPEARRKAGLARTETVLGWCPPHLRDEYRRLLHKKHIPAAEARKMIETQIASDERARLAAMTPLDRQMEKLANGARLVTNVMPSRVAPDFTLGGVSGGML